MEQLGFNGIIGAIFAGYKEAKDARKPDYDAQFELLEKSTNFLYDSAQLNDLFEHTKSKENHEIILDHMYHHSATEVDSYRKIEKKIIDKYWGE